MTAEDESEFHESVDKRARRMKRARRSRMSTWRYLAHVGALGWLFILPTVAGAFLGRFLEQWIHWRQLPTAGVGLGLAMGTWLVWREIRRAISDDEESE